MGAQHTRQDTIRVPETRCLECGRTLDAVGTLDGTRPDPQPGEPIACLRCGAAMTMENGALRGFTDEEMEELKEVMDDLARVVRGIHHAPLDELKDMEAATRAQNQ